MEDLTRLLEDTLSNDTNRRESSEARLTQSLSTPGFSVLLTQALQTPMQLHLAQLTALLLKKSVIASWEATEESTFVLADAEKTQARNLLAHSLVQVAHGAAPEHFLDSKFQTAYSLVLAEIVKHDWPEKWPELLPSIMELMTTQAEFALKFFSVATDHIASDHFVDLVPLLFPHLERIFDAPTSSLRLKGRVVSVVQTCLTMLGMIAQSGEGTAGAVLQATVTPWIGRFVHVLQSADDGLSILVVRALTSFVVEWPKDMSSLIPSILPPVWQVLVGSVPQYEAQVVMAADTEGYDSDGASVGKAALTIELLDFIRGLVHAPTKKTRQLVTESLQPLIHTMVVYMQITQSQLELWNEEPNQYVADEDDDSLKHNVRNTGADLLRELETSLGASVLAATVQATQQRLAEPSWRMQEAALLVMGSLPEPLLMARSGSSAVEGLDLPQFLTTLFDVMHASESNIYLKARALWCASRFATAMTETQLNAFIQVAVSGLDRSQVIPVKLYACRALGTFAQHEKADTLIPQYVVDVIHRLLQLTSEATTDTLHVILETLALVVVVPGSDAALQPILQTIVPLWVTNLDDRMVHDMIVDILSAILMQADSASSAGVVLDHVVPTLGNVFSTIHVSQAIEVVELLVKQQNVAPLVVPVLFDPLLNILLTTDDGSVLTNGGDCLKWFVTYASPQIHQFTCALPHTQGMNGVDGVMHVAAKLLSPSISDSGAMAVGGLVTQVLIHLSSVLPVATIQQLLHAVSTRLAAAKMPSLIQSLCTVFARLIHSFGVPTILDTLDTLGVLPFVLTTWIEHQPDFYGMYAIKVTVLALVKLLDAQDPRVLSLVVKGEQVPDTSSGRTLRSQKKDKVYVQVSFATKLVGILAMTFAQFEVDGEEEAEDIDSEDDEEDDGEDEDDAVQNVRPGGPSSIFAPSENYLLSDMLDLGGEEDEEDDLEASMDPLNEVDLKAQITQVMQTLNSKPDFVASVVPGLTAAEKSIIQDILS